MYLIFTDESGTNKDSQIVLYGGIAIEENNLMKSEIIVSDIAKEYFGIENMLEIEIYFEFFLKQLLRNKNLIFK